MFIIHNSDNDVICAQSFVVQFSSNLIHIFHVLGRSPKRTPEANRWANYQVHEITRFAIAFDAIRYNLLTDLQYISYSGYKKFQAKIRFVFSEIILFSYFRGCELNSLGIPYPHKQICCGFRAITSVISRTNILGLVCHVEHYYRKTNLTAV